MPIQARRGNLVCPRCHADQPCLTRSWRSATWLAAMELIVVIVIVLAATALYVAAWMSVGAIINERWPAHAIDMAKPHKSHLPLALPTEAPLARPSLQPPVRSAVPLTQPSPPAIVQAEPTVTHARGSGRGQLAPVPETPGNVTHARTVRIPARHPTPAGTHALDRPAHMAQPAQHPRPATNAERQSAFRARQGDAYRAKHAARMRESRARQRSARLRAAEPQERTGLSAASLP